MELTTNHLGYFEFRLCVNNDVDQIITQECLDQHLLEKADGSGNKHTIHDDVGWRDNRSNYYIITKLPIHVKIK